MLRCICCKNHVHIVLGSGNVAERQPRKFGWPIFTQEALHKTEQLMLKVQADNEEERQMFRDFFARIYPHMEKQARNEKGRFERGTYLPKGEPVIVYDRLISEWFEFAEGKTEQCNYIAQLMLGDFVVPLYDCSLIHYVVPPSRELSRRGEYAWEGRFEISSKLKVI